MPLTLLTNCARLTWSSLLRFLEWCFYSTNCTRATRRQLRRLPAAQEHEEVKYDKFLNELRALDGWAKASAGEGEECGWLCGEDGKGCMTLADISYFPFLERIDATIKTFKVIMQLNCRRRTDACSRSGTDC